MLLPFRDELIEMFERDPRAGMKILGTAGFFALIAASVMISDARRGEVGATPAVIVGATFVGAVVGAFLGAALSMKDTVEARLERGDRVSFVLRALFGWGIWSLWVWFVLIFFGVFFAVIAYIELFV